MANFIKAKAVGLSGSSYEFQLYPAGTHFRELPGVYVFTRPIANGGWHVLYVGQTHDLQGRVGSCLGTHHKYLAALAKGFTHVGVHVFQGREDARLNVESDLIAGLRPELNGTGGQSAYRFA
jgi:excinuclease UvrABC nuclease subunit